MQQAFGILYDDGDQEPCMHLSKEVWRQTTPAEDAAHNAAKRARIAQDHALAVALVSPASFTQIGMAGASSRL